jgi:hypothetical protein
MMVVGMTQMAAMGAADHRHTLIHRRRLRFCVLVPSPCPGGALKERALPTANLAGACFMRGQTSQLGQMRSATKAPQTWAQFSAINYQVTNAAPLLNPPNFCRGLHDMTLICMPYGAKRRCLTEVHAWITGCTRSSVLLISRSSAG